MTVNHTTTGTVWLDVSSTAAAGTRGAPWEIGGPGGYLCSGFTPDDGVVRTVTCHNVPRGTLRGGIGAGGGSFMQVGIRW